MAFAGSLDDLSVVDVLQLLHVSRKSGTLAVEGPGGQARLFLRDGQIVGARHPDAGVNVGNVLREMGAVGPEDIDAALQHQQAAEQERRPLVATLVLLGRLAEEVGWKAMERLVERTVVEVVSWSTGHFDFEAGDAAAVDDFHHLPQGIAVGVDIQQAIMDAVRVLDERHRDSAGEPEAGGPDQALAGDGSGFPEDPADAAVPFDAVHGSRPADAAAVAAVPPLTPAAAASMTAVPPAPAAAPAALRDASAPVTPGKAASGCALPCSEPEADYLVSQLDSDPGAAAAASMLRSRRAVLLCSDGLLRHPARSLCREARIDLYASDVEQNALQRLRDWLDGEQPPVVIVDLVDSAGTERWQHRARRFVEEVRGLDAGLPLVVIAPPRAQSYTELFALGATAVLPRPAAGLERAAHVEEMREMLGMLVACLESQLRCTSRVQARLSEARRQMRMLRERVQEVRAPGGASEVSLVVLRYVAGFLDRCVIFLVRRDDLLGLGAFGTDAYGDSISGAVMQRKVPLAPESLLAEVVQRGEVFHGRLEDPVLATHLYAGMGAPASPEIVLVPLKTADRTAALVYGDFGPRKAAPIETDALEILASHAGLALELALLRHRAG